MGGQATPSDLYERHRDLLRRAIEAVETRAYWSPFPESPSGSVYGDTAADAGARAFAATRDRPFPIEAPGAHRQVTTERSPYGYDLGIGYPCGDPQSLVDAALRALPGWRDVGPHGRAGVAVEILRRINARSFELAHAVQHTTGQPFVMAFQAGGPHAQDRGLEAVAVAFRESLRLPDRARWEKPRRGAGPVAMEKTFTVVPRGVALVIGCTTFPTWNGYPGLFASLVTGNPVIVKPHPGRSSRWPSPCRSPARCWPRSDRIPMW